MATVFVITVLLALWGYRIVNTRLPDSEVISVDSATTFDESGLSILALGDSYTIGENVEIFERWPMQLAFRLQRKAFAVAKPTFVADSGWMTTDLSEAIRSRKLSQAYDLVFLMIGVNDQYRGSPEEDFRQHFKVVLDQAIQLASDDAAKVFAIEIPDWGATPFGAFNKPAQIDQQIAAFDMIIQNECRTAGVVVIPLTNISREVWWNPSKLLTDDDLHPSGLTYARWADHLMPFIENKLSNGIER